MASLRVPEEHKEGLSRLLTLSNENWLNLISTLQTVTISSTLAKTLAVNLAGSDAIPKDDVSEAADTVSALYIVLAYSDEDPAAIANDIAEALQEEAEVRVPEDARNRLTELLSVDSLLISAKAERLMYEYENVFSTARVFTDLRPIFGLDVEEVPKAGIITHTLTIHYFSGGEHKEIRITLDDTDVGTLMNALERADNKAVSLKSILEKAELTYVGPDEIDE